MSFTKESAVDAAKHDLAKRLGIGVRAISAGFGRGYRFSGHVARCGGRRRDVGTDDLSGWKIKLAANGENYEYRADKYQLRLHNFKGKNYVIELIVQSSRL